MTPEKNDVTLKPKTHTGKTLDVALTTELTRQVNTGIRILESIGQN